MGIIAYKVKQRGEKEPVLIFVQSEIDQSNVPRLAGIKQIKEVAHDFEEALEPITAVAESLLNALKAAAPGKVMLEFGVELGGKLGVPLVTEGSGKANFKVQLTWESKGNEAGKKELIVGEEKPVRGKR